MQSLYSLHTLEHEEMVDKDIALKILDQKLEQVLDIFTVGVLYLVRVVQYADTDSQMRSSRYLRTPEDMNVDTSITSNSFIRKIALNPTFIEKLKKDKIELRYIQGEWLKKIYNVLVKTDEYVKYVDDKAHTATADKEIIRHIWEKHVFNDEEVQSYFADELPGWEDDRELIGMLMENFFKNNAKVDFTKLLSGEKKEYAHELIHAVIDKNEYTMGLIEPKLNNWDKERVALIDMLLLRMGVCEFLYFPTIPTKVTINEYIDIAKQYSTPQSGQFVNGVLDNVLKELVKDDKIKKQDRK